MTQRSISGLLTCAAVAVAAGCSTHGGHIAPQQVVHHSERAATLTIARDRSWVGLFAAMKVTLDKAELYSLKRGGHYSVQLEPGEYIMEYRIGLNECSRVIDLKPGQSLHLRLSADCMIYEQGPGRQQTTWERSG